MPLTDLVRQSIYSRLAGYADVNDAARLAQDPTFQVIGSKKILERGAALTSRLQSFETGVLTQEGNFAGLAALSRELVAKAEAVASPRRVVLDMDSTEIPVYGAQEGGRGVSCSPEAQLASSGTAEHTRGAMLAETLHRKAPRPMKQAEVGELKRKSQVIAFSDHYLMDENGRIDLAATDDNTRRWRRDVLSPGLHQPFWRCLADESLPISQASVIRRNTIDWWDFPVEVDVFWDLWLGYLACQTEKACYYLPERLTKYRYHSGSLTATGSGSLGLAYVYSRLIQTPALTGMRDSLRRKCGDAHLYYGLFLLQERRTREAREHVWKAMTLRGPTPKTGLALALASMPGASVVCCLGRCAAHGTGEAVANPG